MLSSHSELNPDPITFPTNSLQQQHMSTLTKPFQDITCGMQRFTCLIEAMKL